MLLQVTDFLKVLERRSVQQEGARAESLSRSQSEISGKEVQATPSVSGGGVFSLLKVKALDVEPDGHGAAGPRCLQREMRSTGPQALPRLARAPPRLGAR